MRTVLHNCSAVFQNHKNVFLECWTKRFSCSLKMQVACLSEMSAFFYQTTSHHISQKVNPHNHHFQTSYLIHLHLLMYRLNDRGNMNFVCASRIVQRQHQQIEILFSNANKITDPWNIRHLYEDSWLFALFTHFLQ